MRALKHAVSVAAVIVAVLAASQVAPFVAGAHAEDVRPRMATNTPRLQLFQGDGTNFMLVDPLFYEIKRTGKTITVPAGFVTDFASVPWYARSLISVLGRHSIPAIVHDYLYWEQRCTRDQADAILREAMNEYSSSWRDQIAVDYAVKYGAQGAWDQNEADRKKGYIRVLTGGYQNIPLNMDWDAYREQLFKQHVSTEFFALPFANSIQAPDIAGLVGALFRIELAQYAIHCCIGERVRPTHGPTDSHEQSENNLSCRAFDLFPRQ